jgi:hypothetical protein
MLHNEFRYKQPPVLVLLGAQQPPRETLDGWSYRGTVLAYRMTQVLPERDPVKSQTKAFLAERGRQKTRGAPALGGRGLTMI